MIFSKRQNTQERTKKELGLEVHLMERMAKMETIHLVLLELVIQVMVNLIMETMPMASEMEILMD